jgi:short-subunit dehydrogenase
VILHEFYHHIRTKEGVHRGSEKNVNCASKFGLLGLSESLALEVNAHNNNNIRVLTIFLGEVATKMWQEYDFSYYEKNKSKMLSPKDVAEKLLKWYLMLKHTSISQHEWSVTSAVEKALQEKQVTFRMTGYALNANNFNGSPVLVQRCS